MSNIWIFVISPDRPARRQAVVRLTGRLAYQSVGYFAQTFQPNSFESATFISTLSTTILCHFQWPWPWLGLIRSGQSKTCWLHFLARFSVYQGEIWYGDEIVQADHREIFLIFFFGGGVWGVFLGGGGGLLLFCLGWGGFRSFVLFVFVSCFSHQGKLLSHWVRKKLQRWLAFGRFELIWFKLGMKVAIKLYYINILILVSMTLNWFKATWMQEIKNLFQLSPKVMNGFGMLLRLVALRNLIPV